MLVYLEVIQRLIDDADEEERFIATIRDPEDREINEQEHAGYVSGLHAAYEAVEEAEKKLRVQLNNMYAQYGVQYT